MQTINPINGIEESQQKLVKVPNGFKIRRSAGSVRKTNKERGQALDLEIHSNQIQKM